MSKDPVHTNTSALLSASVLRTYVVKEQHQYQIPGCGWDTVTAAALVD